MVMRDPSDSSVTLRCVSPSQGPQYSTVKIHRHPDDLFGAGHGAHGLGPDRVADGDVALDGEGGDGERGGVDAHVLGVDEDGAQRSAEGPLVDAEERLGHGGQRGGQQDEAVGYGEREEVAVGGGVHGAGAGR